MSPKLPKLELEQVMQSDAAEMVAAREKAVLIHHTRDIDAAGDEVEKAVRRVIQRKLPAAYYVGHGHIVDSLLNTSPQFDVIIADNSRSPILFITENGTEYFPYESIYAVGEVKSSYYKTKKYVHTFVQNLARVQTELQREKVPPTYLPGGIEVSGSGVSLPGAPPYRNPMLSFMVFIDSNDFQIADVEELYSSTPDSELPNILCLLDKGVVLNAKVPVGAEGDTPLSSINIHPEFNTETAGETNNWIFVPFGTLENRIGANFAFLYFVLAQHLGSCLLEPPNLLQYLNRMFAYEGGQLLS